MCYLCQGLIAPEFAGVDLGLAEKLAVRAVAAAAGVDAAQVAALVRETGDLGQAAERLLRRCPAGGAGRTERRPAWRSPRWCGTLREIAVAEGPGSQGRKLELLAGLLARATPLEARYLLRLVTRNLRLGIGTPTILDALAQVHAGGKAARPVLERGYNICCDLGKVAAAAGERRAGRGGAAAGPAGEPGAGHAGPAAVRRRGDPGPAGRAVRGRVQVRRHPGSGAPHRRRAIELFTRRLEEISDQFPDVVELLAAGLGPAEAIVEGEVVAYDAAAGELRPFGEVMLRRRKHGIDQAVRDVPVGLFCFELLYADGEDLTMLPYPQRRAALEAALTPLAPAAADHRRRGHRPGRARRDVRPGGHRRVRGPGVQVDRAGLGLPGRGARLAVDQAQAGLPDRAVRHRRPGRHRRVRRPRPPRRGLRRGAAGRLRRGRRACSAP